MRVVVVPDSFKDCLGAGYVATAMAAGVRRGEPEADVIIVPVADGGEGTVDAVLGAVNGEPVEVDATGPCGERRVRARYALINKGKTAVIEMAAASGYQVVAPNHRNVRRATTFGTGEVIRDALDRGVSKIIAGLGGSATCDGGAGMAQALGVSLKDRDGTELGQGGEALARLATIDVTKRDSRVETVEFVAACDVNNPLYGPTGTARVYAPQKGAAPEDVELLEDGMQHYAEVIQRELGQNVAEVPGAGAAGGLGAGLMAFCGAELRPGFEVVAEAIKLKEKMTDADLVLTGEGALDEQTGFGKAPAGVAKMAKGLGVPVVALAGALRPGYEALYEVGLTAAFSITPEPMNEIAALKSAYGNLVNTAEAVVRVWKASRGR